MLVSDFCKRRRVSTVARPAPEFKLLKERPTSIQNAGNHLRKLHTRLMFCFPSLARVCASFFNFFFSLREKKCQKHNLNSTESQEKKSSLNSHSFVIQNYTQNSLASGISHTNSLSHTHSKSGKPGPGSTRRPSERPTDPLLRRRYGSTSCPEVIECLGKKP